jgi:hypothetical protein
MASVLTMNESMQPEITVVVAERFGVGESPVWDAERQRLLWCDIPAGGDPCARYCQWRAAALEFW